MTIIKLEILDKHGHDATKIWDFLKFLPSEVVSLSKEVDPACEKNIRSFNFCLNTSIEDELAKIDFNEVAKTLINKCKKDLKDGNWTHGTNFLNMTLIAQAIPHDP